MFFILLKIFFNLVHVNMQAFTHFLMKSQGRFSLTVCTSHLSYMHHTHTSLYMTISGSFFPYSGNDLDTWKHSELKNFQVRYHFVINLYSCISPM